jgi:hypothetical protein
MPAVLAVAAFTPISVAAATPGVASGPASSVTSTADPERASLVRYLSAMSWPVRMSVMRAEGIRAAVAGFISAGDPPYLREVAGRCRKLRAIEAPGGLLRITAPRSVQRSHHNLSRAYSNLRADCVEARLIALRLAVASERYYTTRSPEDKAALERADAAARTLLPRFARTTLRSFVMEVGSWRLALLRYARTLRVPSPRWLTGLQIGP